LKQNRDENHAEQIRQKILASAKCLFARQGYKKTTIRQIVEDSGVLTGSIYYLYHNKADIFQALVLTLMRDCMRLIDERFHDEPAVFKYAAMCMVELKAVEVDELVRETYYEGYTSTAILSQMVRHVSRISEEIGVMPGIGEAELQRRNLLLKGAMRSCVANFYFESPEDSRALSRMLLDLIFFLFAVAPEEKDELKQRLLFMEPCWEEIARQMISGSKQEHSVEGAENHVLA